MPAHDTGKLEDFIQSYVPKSILCDRFAKHKLTLIDPDTLVANGIDVGMVSVYLLHSNFEIQQNS